MSDSIKRHSLEDSILFFYFRYRGNLSKIVEGLNKLPGYENTSIDLTYVEKVIKKFKRRRKDDWGVNICFTFMEYLYMGVQERLCRYQEWLDKFKDAEEVLVSTCHRVPVGERRVGTGAVQYICLDPKCGNICTTMLLNKPDILDLQMRILEEMRKDEDHLLQALKTLGFTVADPPNINKITNYNLTVEKDKQSRSLPNKDRDKKLLGTIDDMDPRSRERLIKDLERDICTDVQFEEEKQDDIQKKQ